MRIVPILICAALCTYLCKQKISELKDYDGGVQLKSGKCRCYKDEDPKEEPPIPVTTFQKPKQGKENLYEHDDRPNHQYESEE
jgi:hypothetical protein